MYIKINYSIASPRSLKVFVTTWNSCPSLRKSSLKSFLEVDLVVCVKVLGGHGKMTTLSIQLWEGPVFWRLGMLGPKVKSKSAMTMCPIEVEAVVE